jgi:hypothetical protein
VKVGVTDFFFAEIQGGLNSGEVVSLELPKEEREKKPAQMMGPHNGGSPKSGVHTASVTQSNPPPPTGTASATEPAVKASAPAIQPARAIVPSGSSAGKS